MKKSNAFALIPIGVFVVFYLSLGIIFEYVMKIPMGFYNVPIVVVFLVALLLIAGDGCDCDGSSCDCGDCGGNGKEKKAKK